VDTEVFYTCVHRCSLSWVELRKASTYIANVWKWKASRRKEMMPAVSEPTVVIAVTYCPKSRRRSTICRWHGNINKLSRPGRLTNGYLWVTRDIANTGHGRSMRCQTDQPTDHSFIANMLMRLLLLDIHGNATTQCHWRHFVYTVQPTCTQTPYNPNHIVLTPRPTSPVIILIYTHMGIFLFKHQRQRVTWFTMNIMLDNETRSNEQLYNMEIKRPLYNGNVKLQVAHIKRHIQATLKALILRIHLIQLIWPWEYFNGILYWYWTYWLLRHAQHAGTGYIEITVFVLWLIFGRPFFCL